MANEKLSEVEEIDAEIASAEQEFQDLSDALKIANQKFDQVRHELISRLEQLSIERFVMNEKAKGPLAACQERRRVAEAKKQELLTQ